MIDVTQDAIQVLLDHPKGEGMIVSCYADTSMTAGFQWLWSQHLKNEAGAIEQRLKDDHQARARFARDLEIIRHALERPAVYTTCPVCQGACERVNLWQEILLFAARHNIMAHTVESHPALAEHGGVAAVLSRPEPWEPAAAGTAVNATGESS